MRRHEDLGNVALIIAAGAIGAVGTNALGSLLHPSHHTIEWTQVEAAADAGIDYCTPHTGVVVDYCTPQTDAQPGYIHGSMSLRGPAIRLAQDFFVMRWPEARPAPVVYVDGARVSDPLGIEADPANGGFRVADLDPADIDQVDVMNGPAAVELYGSEAEHGVIRIFLKESGQADASGTGADSGSN